MLLLLQTFKNYITYKRNALLNKTNLQKVCTKSDLNLRLVCLGYSDMTCQNDSK